jgi:hypothetical protein
MLSFRKAYRGGAALKDLPKSGHLSLQKGQVVRAEQLGLCFLQNRFASTF